MRPHWLSLLLALALQSVSAAGPEARAPGVIVVGADPAAAAARAGIRAGDVIRQVMLPAGSEASAWIPLGSPLQLRAVEWAGAGTEGVRLQFDRDGIGQEAQLPAGTLGLESIPQLPSELAQTLDTLRAEADAKPRDDASVAYAELGAELEARDLLAAAAWTVSERAIRRARDADVPGAISAMRDAQRLAASTDARLPVVAWIQFDTAAELHQSGQLAAAEKLLTELRRDVQRAWPRSRMHAETLHELARNALAQGKPDVARSAIESALKLSRSNGDAFYQGVGLYLRGLDHLWRYDNGPGRRSLEQALQSIRRMEPGGRQEIQCLLRLALVHRLDDELEQAQEYATQALQRIRLRQPSTGLDHALFELGVIASRRQRVREAEGYYREALAYLQEHHPHSQGRAFILNSLGYLKTLRRDHQGARIYYEQALAMFEARGAQADVAIALQNLADTALEQKRYDEAETLALRSLETLAAVKTADPGLAPVWNILAQSALETQRLELAETRYRRALHLQRSAPDSLRAWSSHYGLARTALRGGRPDEARRLLDRALAIVQLRAPGSSWEALTQFEYGRAEEALGRRAEAVDRYLAAVRAHESAQDLLGGSPEERGGFLERYAEFYRSLLRLLLELGRERDAFEILERYRAGLLQDIAAGGGQSLSSNLPETLRSRAADLQKRHDRVLQQSRELPASEVARGPVLQREMDGLRREYAVLRGQMMNSADAARLSSIGLGRTPETGAILAALDPGTVMLSFAVTDRATYLFVLRREGLRVLTLDVARTELETRVASLRALLSVNRPNAALRNAAHAASHRMYRLLLLPVAAEIGKAQRLVILADGSLHALPFAALVTEAAGDTGARPRFLVEQVPLSTALSAAHHVASQRPTRFTPESKVVVFARAQGERSTADSALRGAATTNLPFALAEARVIGSLFGERARLYLGSQATEARAKSLEPRTRVLHFATHAVMREQSPMDSYLLLEGRAAGGEDDDGLLQAWEIQQQIRLDADLVTLAACDTVLGKHYAGAGPLGLHSAFLHAGARNVLGTLWSISDQQAHELVPRFYREIEQGVAVDLALQRAQRAMLAPAPGWPGVVAHLQRWADLLRGRNPRPHAVNAHWAAFQLTGSGS